MTKHAPAKRIEGFGKNASDLFKVAVLIAGFPAGRLMAEIHKRAPRRASTTTVELAMRAVRDEHNAHVEHYSRSERRALLRSLGEEA